MPLAAQSISVPPSAVPAGGGPAWSMPGTLVLRLIGVALVLLVLAGAASAWLVARYVQQDALQQLARQQSDEVDLLARLFAGKIEQVQKQLRGAATRITPQLLAQPAALQRALQQELAAAPWFSTMTVARPDGTVLLHLQAPQAGTVRDSGAAPQGEDELGPDEASAAERALLQRAVREARAQIGEVLASGPAAARMAFSLPLLGANGQVLGALGASVPLQSQAFVRRPLWPPVSQQGQARLLVFTRRGPPFFSTPMRPRARQRARRGGLCARCRVRAGSAWGACTGAGAGWVPGELCGHAAAAMDRGARARRARSAQRGGDPAPRRRAGCSGHAGLVWLAAGGADGLACAATRAPGVRGAARAAAPRWSA